LVWDNLSHWLLVISLESGGGGGEFWVLGS
jgi:hypothetical protein